MSWRDETASGVQLCEFTCTRPSVGCERVLVVTTADRPVTTVSAAVLTAAVAQATRGCRQHTHTHTHTCSLTFSHSRSSYRCRSSLSSSSLSSLSSALECWLRECLSSEERRRERERERERAVERTFSLKHISFSYTSLLKNYCIIVMSYPFQYDL